MTDPLLEFASETPVGGARSQGDAIAAGPLSRGSGIRGNGVSYSLAAFVTGIVVGAVGMLLLSVPFSSQITMLASGADASAVPRHGEIASNARAIASEIPQSIATAGSSDPEAALDSALSSGRAPLLDGLPACQGPPPIAHEPALHSARD